MTYKNWYQSKTIQLALLQAVSGIVLALVTEFPELGYLMIGKSVVDAIIRVYTDKPIQ